MKEMLSKLLNTLKSKNFNSATLVLGNISCDLDSAICSVVYALFLHWQHERLRDRVCTRQHRPQNEQACQQIYVPILNVSRQDYELKTEVEHCLSEVGLMKNDLLFRDDLDLHDLIDSTNTKIILVDHHILADSDNFLKDHVTEIIDHRPKDELNWTYPPGVIADIQQVGSCSTLVCEKIRCNEEHAEFFEIYRHCARFLYNAIILDTVNFSKDVKKGTPLDLEQVIFLEGILQVQDANSHREEVLLELVEARRRVSHLSAAQLLRKDTKVCGGTILVPSFPILVQDFLSKEDVAAALVEELSRTRCIAAVLLGMRLSRTVERDLAVYCDKPDVMLNLSSTLEQWNDPPLQLEQDTCQLDNCRYYTQGNLAASRKQVMPAVYAFVGKEQPPL